MFFEMTTLAYNFSARLKQSLDKIETLRRNILLSPVSPKNELRLKWEAMLQRVYWSFSLTPSPIEKAEVISALSSVKPGRLRKISLRQKEISNYRSALDHIRREHLASQTKLTTSALKKIYLLAVRNDPNARSFSSVEKEAGRLLEYLQTGNEHPAVQAGVAQINFLNLSTKLNDAGVMARLIPYLFLYRHGYDFGGMLVIEEYFRRDVVALRGAIESAGANDNLTLWLEYFAEGLCVQLTKALENISKLKYQTDIPASFWKLNERQREILTKLEEPGVRISNKDVQRIFKVSQITASRDLAKLVSLGLAFTYGKGRSVFYTRT